MYLQIVCRLLPYLLMPAINLIISHVQKRQGTELFRVLATDICENPAQSIELWRSHDGFGVREDRQNMSIIQPTEEYVEAENVVDVVEVVEFGAKISFLLFRGGDVLGVGDYIILQSSCAEEGMGFGGG